MVWQAEVVKVRFAIAPGGGPVDPASLADLFDGLEREGFDTVWLSDVPLGQTVDPSLGLAYAASRTTRLKLGANVVPFGRTPYVLARELAQLDQLTAGRLLVSIVPGLDQPGERDALSIGKRHRGNAIDETIGLLRRWWAGETVSHSGDTFSCTDLALPTVPVQSPLEIWLGGMGPAALDRAGRLSDGWLGANVNPAEAGAARRTIDEIGQRVGRFIDPEHYGLSIPYCRDQPDERMIAALRARRPDGELNGIVPIGEDGLRSLIDDLIAEGLSKFVLRPIGRVTSWDDELSWLSAAILDKQT